MKKKLTESNLIDLIKKEREHQEETARISKERTRARIALIESYGTTVQNFYIRKGKYEKAASKDYSKKV